MTTQDATPEEWAARQPQDAAPCAHDRTVEDRRLCDARSRSVCLDCGILVAFEEVIVQTFEQLHIAREQLWKAGVGDDLMIPAGAVSLRVTQDWMGAAGVATRMQLMDAAELVATFINALGLTTASQVEAIVIVHRAVRIAGRYS